MGNVIAICASDFHLCHRAPVARSAEPDWYAAMARPLLELQGLCERHRAPLVIAGDVFDRWDGGPSAEKSGSPAAELINWTIDHLSEFPNGVFAIPGQHDLPNHRLDEIRRSAFWTLVESDVVSMITPGQPRIVGGLALHGFPWGVPVVPCAGDDYGRIHLAVIHAYIWREGCSYPGADDESHVRNFQSKFRTFHAAISGDNHQGFMVGDKFMNCGTLMRRKSDEINYRPHVGLLYSDGYIEAHYLDTSADLFLEESRSSAAKEPEDADVSSFIEQLKKLQADPLNFREVISRTLDQRELPLESNVRRIVLECLNSQR